MSVKTEEAQTSTDESVAFIEGNNTIRAKRAGQCQVRVDGLAMHTEVHVVVAAHPRGTIVEHIGGIWNPRGLAVLAPIIHASL